MILSWYVVFIWVFNFSNEQEGSLLAISYEEYERSINSNFSEVRKRQGYQIDSWKTEDMLFKSKIFVFLPNDDGNIFNEYLF